MGTLLSCRGLDSWKPWQMWIFCGVFSLPGAQGEALPAGEGAAGAAMSTVGCRLWEGFVTVHAGRSSIKLCDCQMLVSERD